MPTTPDLSASQTREISEVSPGSTTQAHRAAAALTRTLDGDEDDYVIEEYLGADARIRLDSNKTSHYHV